MLLHKGTCLGVYTKGLNFLTFPTAEPYKALYFKNLWSPWKAFCWFQLDQVHVLTLGPCSLCQQRVLWTLYSNSSCIPFFSLLMSKRSQDTKLENWGCWKVNEHFKLECRVLLLSSLFIKNHTIISILWREYQIFWFGEQFQPKVLTKFPFTFVNHVFTKVSVDFQKGMTSKLCENVIQENTCSFHKAYYTFMGAACFSSLGLCVTLCSFKTEVIWLKLAKGVTLLVSRWDSWERHGSRTCRRVKRRERESLRREKALARGPPAGTQYWEEKLSRIRGDCRFYCYTINWN